MITFLQGDIFLSNKEALINTVNIKGVMGKGLALEMKKRFPLAYDIYKKACAVNEIQTGSVQVVSLNSIANPHYIINFPTKKDWKNSSKIEYIESGLISLVEAIRKYNIKSIAVPPLGCGNGGLDWKDVKSLIVKWLGVMEDVDVMVFEPINNDEIKITNSRAAVLRLLENYCTFGDELTLLEVHKLLYFLQEFGEPLKLNFEKQSYGPYARNLDLVLNYFNQHFITMNADSHSPKTVIKLLSEGLLKAKKFELNSETSSRLDKVLNLAKGYQSSYGLELLATVHWLVKYEGVDINSLDNIMTGVETWNARKAEIMRYSHIKKAVGRLKEFIDVSNIVPPTKNQ